MRILFLLISMALLATPSFAGSFEGPLVVKNGFPLYTALNSPPLVSAEPENSLNIDFSYSSTYQVAGNQEWYFGVDLETALLDIQGKQVVGDGLEVGFDLPVIRYGSGFADNAIETYHRWIGMPNAYGRNNRPRNDFLLDVTRNGETVILGKPSETELGDIMVEIKKVLYRQGPSLVSAQAFLNLPTGDPKSGYGSGSANGGASALVNERLGDDIMLYLNAGIGLVHRLKALQEVALKNYYFGGAGLEWRYSGRVLLNMQMIVQSSPYPRTGVSSIDDPSMMASVGGRYRLDDRSSLALTVTEDPDTAGAPDIMISVDYRSRF